MAITTGFSERFGDGPLSFGMKRFEDSDKNPLWRFIVSRYVGGNHAVAQDARAEDLRKMIVFLQRSLEALDTDGGRYGLKP